MKTVSRFEANLLHLLRVIVQQAPKQQAMRILEKPLPRPRCLSRAAVELIEDTLAKGCVHYLAKRGWMRDRFLRGARVATGRLWQRTPPSELGLTFSAHTLEFCVQLTSGSLGSNVPALEATTVGDRLVFFLALDALHANAAGERLIKHWPLVYQDGPCRLAFPGELTDDAEPYRIDWSMWTTGIGASIIETMQADLAGRWDRLERTKGTITSAARMRKIGATQTRVLGEYLDALERAGRRDLARCFLDAAHALLDGAPGAQRWIGSIELRGERLADRRAIYQDALAFMRQFERLHHWQEEAASVGYFDEGYQASQLWKADWERVDGDRLHQQARVLLREVEPI